MTSRFERDLGDGWRVEQGIAFSKPCLELRDECGLCVFIQDGQVVDMETGGSVPVVVMRAFLDAYTEWEKSHA